MNTSRSSKNALGTFIPLFFLAVPAWCHLLPYRDESQGLSEPDRQRIPYLSFGLSLEGWSVPLVDLMARKRRAGPL